MLESQLSDSATIHDKNGEVCVIEGEAGDASLLPWKEKTLGGYEYKIIACSGDEMFGIVLVDEWLPVKWGTDGILSCIPYEGCIKQELGLVLARLN